MGTSYSTTRQAGKRVPSWIYNVRLRSQIIFIVSAIFAAGGCATKDPRITKTKPEKGPQGTVAYLVKVEASEPGVKIEADGDFVGTIPLTLKIFGDKDGTFHNFGRSQYVVRAIPNRSGQLTQTKIFGTGGWFSQEDRIPSTIYFEMSLVPARSGGTGAAPPAPQPIAPEVGQAGTRKVGSGTAFAITDDGYLISNAHVVNDAERVLVSFPDETVEAKVVQKDLRNDLALLKVFKRTQALPLGDSSAMKPGQEVCTLGYPRPNDQGTRIKFDKGTIGALTGFHDDIAQFQIGVPLQPGNSGGPLVNDRGEVVGVVASGLNAGYYLARGNAVPQNVNYAVKSTYLRLLLDTVPDLAGKLPKPTQTEAKPFDYWAEAVAPSVALVVIYR